MTETRPHHPWPTEDTTVPRTWRDVDLTDTHEWVRVYTDLFGPHGQAVHPERAARLAAYGWSPDDLRAVCTAPHTIASMSPPEMTTETEAEALAALTDEATAFSLLGVSASAYRRQEYAARLSETYRWSPEEVLAVIGAGSGGGEPFEAVAAHMRADLLPRIMGPGPVTETLRSLLDDRSRDTWLTPKPTEGPAHD